MFVTLFLSPVFKTVIDEKNISTTRSAVILTLLSIVLSAFYNTAVAQDSSSKE